MQGEVLPVSPDTVVGETAKIKAENCKFLTLSCTEIDENTVEIIYHFEKDLKLKHLRMTFARGITVPSISSVYFAAFLVENEIQDLYGVNFTGLVIDYERMLYLDKETFTSPFCRFTTIQPKPISEEGK